MRVKYRVHPASSSVGEVESGVSQLAPGGGRDLVGRGVPGELKVRVAKSHAFSAVGKGRRPCSANQVQRVDASFPQHVRARLGGHEGAEAAFGNFDGAATTADVADAEAFAEGKRFDFFVRHLGARQTGDRGTRRNQARLLGGGFQLQALLKEGNCPVGELGSNAGDKVFGASDSECEVVHVEPDLHRSEQYVAGVDHVEEQELELDSGRP